MVVVVEVSWSWSVLSWFSFLLLSLSLLLCLPLLLLLVRLFPLWLPSRPCPGHCPRTYPWLMVMEWGGLQPRLLLLLEEEEESFAEMRVRAEGGCWRLWGQGVRLLLLERQQQQQE